jgi:hypothetical protein
LKLTYFDARGRAQYVRCYLRARGIAFEDHRIALGADWSAWLAIRSDRSAAGPFHKLPVLHWGGQLIAETTVIHAFLHKALGDEARLSDEDNLRHAMLVSSLYVDVMLPIGTLIWADVGFAGVDLAALAKRTLDRLRNHLTAVNRTLAEWRWLDEAAHRPVMLADCMLWEELNAAEHVFGAHLGLAELGTLTRFAAASPVREHAAMLLRDQPAQITGRPAEDVALAKLRALLG